MRVGSLHQSILQGLRDVVRAHICAFGKISDRACDFSYQVVAARAETKPLDGGAQQDTPPRIRPAERRDGGTPQIRVRTRVLTAVARVLGRSGNTDASPYGGCRLSRVRVRDGLRGNGGDVDDEIDAVAQRSGEAAAVLRDLDGRAAADPPLVAQKPTRARIHGGDKNEVRRKDRGASRAGNRHATVLERLSQHLEHAPVELGHLVEEEHAVVRE